MTPPIFPPLKTAPAKKRPGRPRTGQTPPAERQRKSRENALRAGGRRLNVTLTPEGAEALAKVHAEHPGKTETEAVHIALHWYARRKSRKPA